MLLHFNSNEKIWNIYFKGNLSRYLLYTLNLDVYDSCMKLRIIIILMKHFLMTKAGLVHFRPSEYAKYNSDNKL